MYAQVLYLDGFGTDAQKYIDEVETAVDSAGELTLTTCTLQHTFFVA